MRDEIRRSSCAALCLVALSALSARAQAGAAGTLLEAKQGTLTYTVVHKFHEVQGTTHAVEGRALVQPDGIAKVQIRAPVASFDSGNSNRDAHMREATHEVEHPHAEVKGRIAEVQLPLSGPVTRTLTGTVELNGEKQPISVPVALKPAGDGVRASFTFTVSLDALKVERPQLLFVKVDDGLRIDGDLTFGPAK